MHLIQYIWPLWSVLDYRQRTRLSAGCIAAPFPFAVARVRLSISNRTFITVGVKSSCLLALPRRPLHNHHQRWCDTGSISVAVSTLVSVALKPIQQRFIICTPPTKPGLLSTNTWRMKKGLPIPAKWNLWLNDERYSRISTSKHSKGVWAFKMGERKEKATAIERSECDATQWLWVKAHILV